MWQTMRQVHSKWAGGLGEDNIHEPRTACRSGQKMDQSIVQSVKAKGKVEQHEYSEREKTGDHAKREASANRRNHCRCLLVASEYAGGVTSYSTTSDLGADDGAAMSMLQLAPMALL